MDKEQILTLIRDIGIPSIQASALAEFCNRAVAKRFIWCTVTMLIYCHRIPS